MVENKQTSSDACIKLSFGPSQSWLSASDPPRKSRARLETAWKISSGAGSRYGITKSQIAGTLKGFCSKEINGAGPPLSQSAKLATASSNASLSSLGTRCGVCRSWRYTKSTPNYYQQTEANAARSSFNNSPRVRSVGRFSPARSIGKGCTRHMPRSFRLHDYYDAHQFICDRREGAASRTNKQTT